MSLRHLPYTILMLLINIAPIIAMLLNTMIFSYGILAYFLLGFSTLAFANSFFLVKIFDKYIPQDEDAEEEKDADDWTIEGLREELEDSSDDTAASAGQDTTEDDTTEQIKIPMVTVRLLPSAEELLSATKDSLPFPSARAKSLPPPKKKACSKSVSIFRPELIR